MTHRGLSVLILCVALSMLACGAPAAVTDTPTDIPDSAPEEATVEPIEVSPVQPTEILWPPALYLVTPDGEVAGAQGSYCWTPGEESAGLCRDNLWPTDMALAGTFARDETLIFRFEDTPAQEIIFDMYPYEMLAQGPSESGAVDSMFAAIENGEAQWPLITVPGSYFLVAHATWESGDDAIYLYHIDVFFDEAAERAMERSPASIVAPDIVLDAGSTLVEGQVLASCWPLFIGRGGSSPPPFCYENEIDTGSLSDATVAVFVLRMAVESVSAPDEITLSLVTEIGAEPATSAALMFEQSDEGRYEVRWVPDEVPGGHYLLVADAIWTNTGSSTTVFRVNRP